MNKPIKQNDEKKYHTMTKRKIKIYSIELNFLLKDIFINRIYATFKPKNGVMFTNLRQSNQTHLSFKNICIVINVNGWFFAVFFINGFIWYILELHLYIGLNCSTINSEKKTKDLGLFCCSLCYFFCQRARRLRCLCCF